jgi:hypothetical protein
MKTICIIIISYTITFATQWNNPECLGINIGGTSFTADNQIAYCSVYDPYYASNIAYYHWDGSQWIYMDQIQGDVNTTHQESQPFITYDGQYLFYDRSVGSTLPPYHIWVATWNGSGFYNSVELNPLINSGDCREPSLTQDGLKLYFTRSSKIYESVWNGSDWGSPIILPDSVNEPGFSRDNVTISPDGNEIYFTGAYDYYMWLAFSQKISGVWQQWQYCDSNINTPNCQINSPALTYAPYGSQELYFNRNNSPSILTWHALRSPVSVEPASLGQIKATYQR